MEEDRIRGENTADRMFSLEDEEPSTEYLEALVERLMDKDPGLRQSFINKIHEESMEDVFRHEEDSVASLVSRVMEDVRQRENEAS